MRTFRKFLSAPAVIGVTALAVLLCMNVVGGNLEPDGPVGSTMHTLEEIYDATNSLSLGELTGPVSAARTRSIAYMNVNNLQIEGESNDPNHQDWIELLAVHYSGRHPSNTTRSRVGGRTGRRVDFSDITVIKEIDKSTPKLHLHCAQGTSFNQMLIEFTAELSTGRFVYHTITLKDVVITSFRPIMSHRCNGEYIHLEEVSLQYSQIYWDYTPYDDQGATGPTESTGWDVFEGRSS